MNIKDYIFDLIFPKVGCIACGHPRETLGEDMLCDTCRKDLYKLLLKDEVCPRCLSRKKSDEVCEFCLNGGMDNIEGAFSPFYYSSIVQKLIVALKFRLIDDAALSLAKEMSNCIRNQYFDFLTPVPLSKKHLKERGKNQSLILCEIVSKISDIDVLEVLLKNKNTKRQSSIKNDKEREKNVASAFSVKEPYAVKDKIICLVDDVRTSGATARACAKALKYAGAREVYLLTAAVASRRKDK